MAKAIESEKELRVKQLPRFRPEDQIDADEEALELLRDVYDACPRFEGIESEVSVLDFFVKIRKDP
jgi:hypothetical protein